MANRITREELLKKTEKIFFTRVKNETFGLVHRDLIRIWIERHCTKSWYYWNDEEFYVFGSAADYALFKMWIRGNPFINKDGDPEGSIDAAQP